MNKRVYKVMLALVLTFIAGIYVLKVFFPNDFMLVIENQKLVHAGQVIDNTPVLDYLCSFLIAYIFDYLYFGAVCQKKKLGIRLSLIITLYNAFFVAFYRLAPAATVVKHANLLLALSNCYMILIPMFFTKHIKGLSVTYTINSIAQLLTLNIRNLSLLLTNANFITTTLMSIECFFWMLVCYMLFTRKEEKTNGTM